MISYAHEAEEGPAWAEQALALANLLDDHGFATEIDQRHAHESIDWAVYGPARCTESDFVVCLASPEYASAWTTEQQGSDNGQGNFGAREETRAIIDRKKRTGNGFLVWAVLDGRTQDDMPPAERSVNWVAVPAVTALGVSGLLARLRGRPLDPLGQPARVVADPRPSGHIVGPLPPRFPYFTGRRDLLRKLAESSQRQGTTVVRDSLAGGGGVGKTELAVEHAYELLDQQLVDWVGFVVADQTPRLITDLTTVAERLGVPPLQDDESAELFFGRIREALEAGVGGSFLLIVDNAEPEVPLADLLPRQGTGQVVITTRDRQMGETLAAEPLVVDVFDPQTAFELLRRRVPDLSIDDQVLAELAERVGFLPIAVDLVGYQLANGYGPAEVLAGLPEFNASRRDVTIGALWQNTMPRLNLPAQRLLKLFSVLAPDRVPVGHLDSVEFDPPMESPGEALATLRRWGLIERIPTGSGPAVSIHRVLQDVVRSGTAELAGAYTDATSLLRSALPADVRIPTGWATMAELEPHIRVLFKLVDARQAPSVELATNVWWLVDDVAAARRHGGDDRTALPLFEQADSFARRVLGLDSPNTLTARANLASSYRQAGRTNDAITIQERVVQDRERLIGVDHPSTLTARANLASSYRQAGRTNDAITIEERVVEDRERLIGVDHPDTLTARANLASSYRQAGRTNDAITIDERVVEDRERLIGVDHPDTLTARANLASSYRQAGRTNDAITIGERVVEDSERLIGVDHPSTLTARANLASSYWQAGRTNDAITIDERVVEDRERLIGVDHPDTLTARANLASSYRQAGRTNDAITIGERVVEDSERLIGVDHPSTLTARANLASSYWQAGRTNDAITIGERVVEDRERLIGVDHPSTLTARANLAASYWQAGRTSDAIKLLQAVVDRQDGVTGPDHPEAVARRAGLTRWKREAETG
jgi:hypothetical protein